MKKADHVTILGGADGPTSIFLVGGKTRGGKRSFKQRWQKYLYDRKKKKIEKQIKPDGHSLKEVADYVGSVLGCGELDKTAKSYQIEYKEMRTSFIIQYAPELLGEYAEHPQLESPDAEGLQKFQEAMERRMQAAEKVPKEVFDIDLHIWEKKEADSYVRWILENRYQYIGMSASGPKKKMKQFKKWEKDIWRYYGVTQEDIDKKTDRYRELVRALAR